MWVNVLFSLCCSAQTASWQATFSCAVFSSTFRVSRNSLGHYVNYRLLSTRSCIVGIDSAPHAVGMSPHTSGECNLKSCLACLALLKCRVAMRLFSWWIFSYRLRVELIMFYQRCSIYGGHCFCWNILSSLFYCIHCIYGLNCVFGFFWSLISITLSPCWR